MKKMPTVFLKGKSAWITENEQGKFLFPIFLNKKQVEERLKLGWKLKKVI